MFKNMFDLSFTRKGFEVLGFYITYLILGTIIAGIICGLLIAFIHPEIKSVEDATYLAIKYAPVLAMLYGVGLSISIISAKNAFNSFNAVILTIIAVPLLFFGGLSLGLIPVSFITKLQKND